MRRRRVHGSACCHQILGTVILAECSVGDWLVNASPGQAATGMHMTGHLSRLLPFAVELPAAWSSGRKRGGEGAAGLPAAWGS